jgi:hypothetical protein
MATLLNDETEKAPLGLFLLTMKFDIQESLTTALLHRENDTLFY